MKLERSDINMEDNRSWDLECSVDQEWKSICEQERLEEIRKNRRQRRSSFFKGFALALILLLALSL